jgi:hypothetical protein
MRAAAPVEKDAVEDAVRGIWWHVQLFLSKTTDGNETKPNVLFVD